jgi:hypothetical protein
VWHREGVGSKAAAAVVLVVLLAPSPAAAAAPGWPLTRVMRALDGRRVPVAGKTVRIEAESTLCGGQGRAIRVDGVRRWARFACTFTSFGRRGIERDLDFRVTVVAGRHLRVGSAAWVPPAVPLPDG